MLWATPLNVRLGRGMYNPLLYLQRALPSERNYILSLNFNDRVVTWIESTHLSWSPMSCDKMAVCLKNHQIIVKKKLNSIKHVKKE